MSKDYDAAAREITHVAAREIAQLMDDLRAKDEEIDRLKEENAHLAWRDKDKNTLITELARELRAYQKNYNLISTKIDALLESARKATNAT